MDWRHLKMSNELKNRVVESGVIFHLAEVECCLIITIQ